MANTNLLSEFYDFLLRYTDFYEDFLQLETQKYEVVSENEFRQLDDFIKKEQAYLLQSKGLEQEKERFLTQMGSNNITLRDLIATISDEEMKDDFQQLYRKLSGILLNLKEANRLCNFLIELHLHRIGSQLKNLNAKDESVQGYDTKAKKFSNSNNNNISKKV